jgi:glucose uptake protein
VTRSLSLRESEHQATSRRGVVISLIAGLLMGTFYPFVSRAMTGAGAPGPYAISFYFVIGVALCAIPFNYLLMRKPLDAQRLVSMTGFAAAPPRWHLWGIAGGAVWCTGAVFNFVASKAHVVGPAVSYSIGQGATMISAAWGVFLCGANSLLPHPVPIITCSGCLFFFCWDSRLWPWLRSSNS